MVVYNAEGHVMGRLCSAAAKRLLNGEQVTIVNAEKAIITGNRSDVLANFRAKKERGKDRRGPYYPRRADLMLKRAVRGMIPFKTATGRKAYKNLKVFVGVPAELASSPMEKVERATQLGTDKYITLGEVSEYLGSTVR